MHTEIEEELMFESRSKFIAIRSQTILGAGSHVLSHCSKDPENYILFRLWNATDKRWNR